MKFELGAQNYWQGVQVIFLILNNLHIILIWLGLVSP